MCTVPILPRQHVDLVLCIMKLPAFITSFDLPLKHAVIIEQFREPIQAAAILICVGSKQF
jgi:hypothetical protein